MKRQLDHSGTFIKAGTKRMKKLSESLLSNFATKISFFVYHPIEITIIYFLHILEN